MLERNSGFHISVPDWLDEFAPPGAAFLPDEARMQVAVSVAHENVVSSTGGPFGAGVFERRSGKLIAAGVNLVLPNKNSVLHAEVVAIMLAEKRLDSFDLGAKGGTECELVTSCEPCAMCLGAIHWSGVTRLVIGATREDGERIRFDEGPVFPSTYQYLEERGLEIIRGVCRKEASEVLELYARMNGVIY
jgi:tRNA(Arg) A34 adenosine deaminase TadA